ncbi:MAG: adenylate kinase [Parcubacteria group bacterium LiPW_15]|nr:MAG: adenylate kinase [Parcubacteria group bacterium LiPW_15]
MKKVVIIYGPPGAGKGTQANLLAAKLNMIHFDTGKYFEKILHDPANQKNRIIRRERKLFDTGILLTPSWVVKTEEIEARKIHAAGFGLIFSGSLRTMYEAKHFIPVLTKLYGRKNLHVFALNVPAEVSIKRNSNRMMCKFCGYGLLSAYYDVKKPKHCPVCGGPFYKRTLDNPATIKIRLKEYKERTEPILDFMKENGIKVLKLDARPAPYKVFERIEKILK